MLFTLAATFKIPGSDLELLRKKLELIRFPVSYDDAQWGEESEGGVTIGLMRETVEYWRAKYDWRAVEARLNKMPQFKTAIQPEGFDPVELHFAHAKAPSGKGAPVLLLHGWPGSFTECEGVLPRLLEPGFDVVAPSLPGYDFSS